MNTKLLHLTARLLARTANPRGEGDDDQQPARFTREEWQAKRKAELADTQIDVLIKKTSDLEFDLREARRKVPKEGARILTPEEATEYDALVALGKAADLKTQLDAGAQATADLSARARGDELRNVADLTGANLKVLTRLAGDLRFEIGDEVEKDGKKSRPITVKDGEKAKPFETYLAEDWADLAPALMAGKTEVKTGAEFTRQDSTTSSGGSGGSWVQDKLKAAAATTYKDPLQATAATTGVTP